VLWGSGLLSGRPGNSHQSGERFECFRWPELVTGVSLVQDGLGAGVPASIFAVRAGP
jgi:hypothetical protein